MVFSIGNANLQSHLHQFDGFESFDSSGVSLIAHADMVRKLWNDNFGPINYIYLQHMSIHELVTGLSCLYCINGVCRGYALGTHYRDPFPVGGSTCAKVPLELIHSDLISFPTPYFLGA